MANIDKIRLKGVEYELSGSGGGSVDAYTKSETDGLLNKKQDKITGDYVKDVEIGGGYITFNSMKFDGNNNGVKTANFKTINNKESILGAGNINVVQSTSGSPIIMQIVALTSSEYKTLLDKGGASTGTLYIIKD